MKYLIITAIALLSCSTKPTNNPTNNNKQNLVAVDVTKKYPEKTIYVQDIADIEYIPLETNDNALIRGGRPDGISEQHIVYHNQDGKILVFNRQGKLLYSFNRTGGGPEEYNFLYHITLDKKKEELYIPTQGDLCTIVYVYSINGTFKRKFILSDTTAEKYTLQAWIDYDEDHLLCYNTYYTNPPKDKISAEDKNRNYPYVLFSKKTGKITPLNYSIPNKIGNHIYPADGKGPRLTFSIFPLKQNNPDILITDFADDTLYSLKNGKLLPVMIKKPSAHKMTPPMLVGVSFFTDRYIFIDAVEKKLEGELKQNSMVYDKQTNDFYQLNLLNKDDSNKYNINLIGTSLLHNTSLCLINPGYLLQAYNDGKLQGTLKLVASKLKEDDNPVLMLIKFKE